jgi:hypothetical protein
MKFSVKIPGIEHQSQIVTIDRKKLIPVGSVKEFLNNGDDFYKYEGREVFVKYIGKSRIDGHPIFIIDTTSLEREDKILKIIYTK